MNNNEFESSFDRLFEQAAEKSESVLPVEIPDPASSWNKVRIRMARKRKIDRLRASAKWAALSAASLLLGATVFHTLQKTEAFEPMFEMVYKVKGNSTTIHFGSTGRQDTSGAKTAPPPPDDGVPPPVKDNRDLPDEGNFRRVKMSLAQAAEETQFRLPKPAYLPQGYALEEAVVHYSLGESKGSAARLSYRDSSGSKTIVIVSRLKRFSDNGNVPDGKRLADSGPAEVRELEWNQTDINVIVKAELDDRELNRIADGMTGSP